MAPKECANLLHFSNSFRGIFSKNNNNYNNKYAIELRCLYTQVLAKLQQ